MNKNEFYQFTFYSMGNPNFNVVSKELPEIDYDIYIFTDAYVVDKDDNFFGGENTTITVNIKSFNAFASQVLKLDM